MIHVVDFFRRTMGAGGSALVAVIFIALTVLGVMIAMRGRSAMMWIVSVCAFICGMLIGGMIGILVFDSIIVMIILSAIFSVLLVVVVKYFKGIGYFIGIASLGWFLAFVITSEMNVAGDTVNENTLLFIDLIVGVIMGIMAACRSKYIISVITAASGGVITAISSLALIGFYFADIKTWIIATAVAVFGFVVQIRRYDLKPVRRKKDK